MKWTHWSALAKATAEYAQTNLVHLRRGTIQIDTNTDGVAVIAYFGNGINAEEHCVTNEVERLRIYLAREGTEELGFGLSDDGRSWALITRASGKPKQSRLASGATL